MPLLDPSVQSEFTDQINGFVDPIKAGGKFVEIGPEFWLTNYHQAQPDLGVASGRCRWNSQRLTRVEDLTGVSLLSDQPLLGIENIRAIAFLQSSMSVDYPWALKA